MTQTRAPEPVDRFDLLEPPQRTYIATDPDVDAVVGAVRRWHADADHEGVLEFCDERPCRDVVQVVRP